MKLALAKGNPLNVQSIGAHEAPSMTPKTYLPPDTQTGQFVPPGGAATPSGLAVGGIDMNSMQPGNQLMPSGLQALQPPPPQPQQGSQQAPQGQQAPQAGGNILQMTPQGRAMAAIGPQQAPGMASGGGVKITKINPREWAGTGFGYRGATYGIASHPHIAVKREPHGWTAIDTTDRSKRWFGEDKNELENELAKDLLKPTGMAKGGSLKKSKPAPREVESLDDDDEEEKAPSKRILVKAEGPGGVTGIVIPHHMLHGRSWINKKGKKVVVPGLKDINKARAEVYGSENRDPLTIGQIGKIHKETLEEHFKKPLKEQLKAEVESLGRLRAAKHIGNTANTLDESEKLDTVRHETDEEGRTHVGYASKGVAGHALYISGHGKNAKHHIINTCPGQTEGCGGGKDSKGVVNTMEGTCFAPKAESQYVHAAVRRASHEQAKHDPAMTRDWILAHTGSLRHAANMADKKNQRVLFRPNVVDETDTTSRHVLRHLNEQRKADGKPPIIANSYGKTNELHDPENGYYVTHSNVGPKVKHGREITENIGRDKARVRNTVMAADNRGDFKNEQGKKTPPKGSYLVTDVKRNSPLSKEMEKHITHAKYWTTGREEHELSPEEKAEGPEGHFGPNGKSTTPEKAHYGHTTVNGRRYDYQKQHVLHPRLVNVPERKKNKKTGQMETKDHMIPTDSRFKDTEFLPKKRFMTPNGKEAGHILMTTPTESTSNLGHETPFTHNVSPKHIEHAKANNGEYEIDSPMEQEKARGKEYVAPQPIKITKKAMGGMVGGSRHPGYEDDDFHAFPESNVAAQRHLAMRRGDDEEVKSRVKSRVPIHKSIDTMRLELMRK
jgi:hypothetical protein